MDGGRCFQVFQSLGERYCQPRRPAQKRSDRQVVALDKGRRDVFRIDLASDDLLPDLDCLLSVLLNLSFIISACSA